MRVLLETLIGTIGIVVFFGSPFALSYVLGWIKQKTLGPKKRLLKKVSLKQFV